jgi:hypothetical protein
MSGETLARFRQPEYTGENRCVPCTVVNTGIGAIASAGVGAGLATAASPTAGLLAGTGLFAACLLVIYLRGYLVPRTPELTKQYFPAWLLGLFGTEPVTVEPTVTDIDTEAELVAAGALEECADSDDLCLTDDFRDSWVAAIERVTDEDSGRDRLLDLLEVDQAEVHFQEYGSAFQARVDGTTVGKWESQAAFLADLGAATTLADSYDPWDRLSLKAKSQLLNGLRLFIDTCPSCGGTPEFGTDTVESCCSTHEVAAVSCVDCDARLFETPV